MPERTPGGLFYVDPETHAELLAPVAKPPFAKPRSIPSFSTGRRIGARLASEYFVTDPEAWLVELYDPALLLVTGELTVDALIPILEEAARVARPIAIGAPKLGDDVVMFLIVNKLRGTLTCAAFELDAAGLADLAAFAGGRAFATVADANLDALPRAVQLVLSPTGLSIQPRQ